MYEKVDDFLKSDSKKSRRDVLKVPGKFRRIVERWGRTKIKEYLAIFRKEESEARKKEKRKEVRKEKEGGKEKERGRGRESGRRGRGTGRERF